MNVQQRGDAGSDREKSALLEAVIPFRFLNGTERLGLLDSMERCTYRAGDMIIEQGATDTWVYLLGGGTASIQSPQDLDKRSRLPRVISTVEEGHYFGEWESVFDCPRTYNVLSTTDTWSYRIPGDVFIGLLNVSSAFAQGLGTLLRDRQGIFAAFERFKAQLFRDVTNGYLVVRRLLPLYESLEPALHPGAANPTVIDVSGLSYAVRRLPDNITRTFALLLTDNLVGAYSTPDQYFPQVETSARRREVWEMVPGKNLVLLRNGVSDLIDFVTCLCTYAVEAKKIRKRLSTPACLEALSSYLSSGDHPPLHELLAALPFSEEEAAGITRVWPEDTARRLFEIVRHREMFGIDVRRGANTYNSRRAELWASQVAQAAGQLLGHPPALLPDDVEVHIISSNTHSVTNCLNPWYRRKGTALEQWAQEHEPELYEAAWTDSYDRMYSAARSYFLAHPEEAEDAHRVADSAGIYRLRSTASTGIQVQLIDVSRLFADEIDPGIRKPTAERRIVLVNIDYAFGEQAEHIMRNLLLLFGRNVSSINFLGKAGALVGKRGDILEPTAFIEQSGDLFQPVPDRPDFPWKRLQERVPAHTVHRGPILTVDGTLLQNRVMLNFYRRIRQCIGLEMEGTYYYRQVLESMELGVVSRDVDLRFFYYVSDLPLQHDLALSSRLQVSEGVPPLYGITRHILDEVFRGR
ncbi:MAG: hypothetical protein EA383_05445 [Spirochaetaceae bacterium]|nr:MAG: hypothetical protein EA383_05445 [Spirochaetaceae bacterium]